MTTPPDFADGILTAAKLQQVSDAIRTQPRGIVAAPTSTTSNGTATAADTTEVYDAVLGNYVFIAEANRWYRVHYSGLLANTATANCRFICRIRDSGDATTPDTADTLLAEVPVMVTETGSTGRVICHVEHPFTASAGTHTLAAFTQSPDSAILTPVAASPAGRQLYVEDIGPVV